MRRWQVCHFQLLRCPSSILFWESGIQLSWFHTTSKRYRFQLYRLSSLHIQDENLQTKCDKVRFLRILCQNKTICCLQFRQLVLKTHRAISAMSLVTWINQNLQEFRTFNTVMFGVLETHYTLFMTLKSQCLLQIINDSIHSVHYDIVMWCKQMRLYILSSVAKWDLKDTKLLMKSENTHMWAHDPVICPLT